MFDVSVSGRKVIITPAAGRLMVGFPIGTFVVTPIAGNLVCTGLGGPTPDVATGTFRFSILAFCTGTTVPDVIRDCDVNGLIDQCEAAPPPCSQSLCADFSGDGNVDPDDLADFIRDYFMTPAVPGPGGYATANVCPWPAMYVRGQTSRA